MMPVTPGRKGVFEAINVCKLAQFVKRNPFACGAICTTIFIWLFWWTVQCRSAVLTTVRWQGSGRQNRVMSVGLRGEQSARCEAVLKYLATFANFRV